MKGDIDKWNAALDADIEAQQAHDDDDSGLPFGSEQELADTFANQAIGYFKWSPGMEWMANKGTHWERDDLLTRYTLAKGVCKRAASGLESYTGWAMAGCFVGALVLLALAVVLAGLGSCAEQEEDEKPCKERQPQEKRAADRRKAG